MPPFLYTIIFFSLATWFGVIKIVLATDPTNVKYIFLFLSLLFLALSFTLSLPLYFHLNRRSKNPIKHRQIFRRSIKLGFILGAGVTTFMALRAFELLTPLNALLFLVPYTLIFWQELRKR